MVEMLAKFLEARLYDIARKIEETKKQQADLLFGLIHVGPKLLRQFIISTGQDLQLLSSLCIDAKNHQNYFSLVEPAFRLIHTIKGNAALFDLSIYKAFAIEMEDELGKMEHAASASVNVQWVDAILSTIDSAELALEQTERILHELIDIQHNKDFDMGRNQTLLSNIRILIDKLSRESGKQVTLRCEQFDVSLLSEIINEYLVEVVTQLVSNAVIHGIENSQQRQAAGKFPVGLVCLSTHKTDNEIIIQVQDDGAGPNLKYLKELAIKNGKYTEQQLAKMGNSEAAQLIFLPGLSTAKVPTDAAGRGVGMDVVRKNVDDMGGRLNFRFASGQGCQFEICLPVNSQQLPH